jgi:hypothetical protein
MSLKSLANKVLSREHENEHGVNTPDLSCSTPVKTRLSDVETGPSLSVVGSEVSDTVPELSSLYAERGFTAFMFLGERLAEPRRISELIAEWCGGARHVQRNGYLRWEGGRNGNGGHWIADLNRAREELSAEVYEGPDGCMWWRLPVRTPPVLPPPPEKCPGCDGQAFWRNGCGWWLCGTCFEPTLPEMVVEWSRPAQEAA